MKKKELLPRPIDGGMNDDTAVPRGIGIAAEGIGVVPIKGEAFQKGPHVPTRVRRRVRSAISSPSQAGHVSAYVRV